MTKMLDILEDFLTGLNIIYERIDGGNLYFYYLVEFVTLPFVLDRSEDART